VHKDLANVGLFTGAFTGASTLAFAAMAALGAATRGIAPFPYRLGAFTMVLVGSLLLDGTDLRRGAVHAKLSCRRQTAHGVGRRLGGRRAAFAWGADAGLGFTTYRTTSLYWAVVVAALIGLAPWWTGIVYASAFTAPLVLAWTYTPLSHDESVAVHASCWARSRITRMRQAALLLSIAGCATLALVEAVEITGG
jgi:hypothetical protein